MSASSESAFLHTVRIAKTARVNGQPMMMNQADFSILQTAILRLDVPIDGGAFQVEERADEIVIHAANWHLAFYIRHSFNIQQAEEEEKLAVYMARMPVPFGSDRFTVARGKNKSKDHARKSASGNDGQREASQAAKAPANHAAASSAKTAPWAHKQQPAAFKPGKSLAVAQGVVGTPPHGRGRTPAPAVGRPFPGFAAAKAAAGPAAGATAASGLATAGMTYVEAAGKAGAEAKAKEEAAAKAKAAVEAGGKAAAKVKAQAEAAKAKAVEEAEGAQAAAEAEAKATAKAKAQAEATEAKAAADAQAAAALGAAAALVQAAPEAQAKAAAEEKAAAQANANAVAMANAAAAATMAVALAQGTPDVAGMHKAWKPFGSVNGSPEDPPEADASGHVVAMRTNDNMFHRILQGLRLQFQSSQVCFDATVSGSEGSGGGILATASAAQAAGVASKLLRLQLDIEGSPQCPSSPARPGSPSRPCPPLHAVGMLSGLAQGGISHSMAHGSGMSAMSPLRPVVQQQPLPAYSPAHANVGPAHPGQQGMVFEHDQLVHMQRSMHGMQGGRPGGLGMGTRMSPLGGMASGAGAGGYGSFGGSAAYGHASGAAYPAADTGAGGAGGGYTACLSYPSANAPPPPPPRASAMQPGGSDVGTGIYSAYGAGGMGPGYGGQANPCAFAPGTFIHPSVHGNGAGGVGPAGPGAHIYGPGKFGPGAYRPDMGPN